MREGIARVLLRAAREYSGTKILSAGLILFPALLAHADSVTWQPGNPNLQTGDYWGTAPDWSTGKVPTSADDVFISGAAAFAPNIVGNSYSVNSLTQTGTASLLIASINGGSLTVANGITSSATSAAQALTFRFTGANGTSELLEAGGASNIPFGTIQFGISGNLPQAQNPGGLALLNGATMQVGTLNLYGYYNNGVIDTSTLDTQSEKTITLTQNSSLTAGQITTVAGAYILMANGSTLSATNTSFSGETAIQLQQGATLNLAGDSHNGNAMSAQIYGVGTINLNSNLVLAAPTDTRPNWPNWMISPYEGGIYSTDSAQGASGNVLTIQTCSGCGTKTIDLNTNVMRSADALTPLVVNGGVDIQHGSLVGGTTGGAITFYGSNVLDGTTQIIAGDKTGVSLGATIDFEAGSVTEIKGWVAAEGDVSPITGGQGFNASSATVNLYGNAKIVLDQGAVLAYGTYNLSQDAEIDSSGGVFDASVLNLQGDLNVSNGLSVTDGSSMSIAGAASNSGTLSIDGTSSVTINSGTYTQSGGTTEVNGSLSATDVTIDGGTLKGDGTVTGNVVVGSAVLKPGDSPGTLTVTGDLTLSSTTTFLLQIQDATDFDVLNVDGSVDLAGAFSLQWLNNFVPSVGESFDILNYCLDPQGSGCGLTGQFANNIGGITATEHWALDYSHPGYVALDILSGEAPEPGTIALAGLALGLIAAVRRRSAR